MPARDRNNAVEAAGYAFLVLSFAGVLSHGVVRIVSSRKNRRRL
jgi:hypothetical protein